MSVTRRSVPALLLVAAVLTMSGLTACGPASDGRAGGEVATAPPSAPDASSAGPTAAPRPVADSGGTCKLLSHKIVTDTTGARFDAAAASKDACALQVYGHAYPSLTLATTETEADAETFRDAVTPEDADAVKDLGEAAYRTTTARRDGTGPGAEVGWLENGTIYILRYTFERGASDGQAAAMAAKLTRLARKIKPRD